MKKILYLGTQIIHFFLKEPQKSFGKLEKRKNKICKKKKKRERERKFTVSIGIWAILQTTSKVFTGHW